MGATRLEQLAARRTLLQSQAAAQRAALAQQLQRWRPPLALADRGIACARTAARHPLLIAAAAVLLATWRPRRALGLVQYGLMAWQLLRRIRAAAK